MLLSVLDNSVSKKSKRIIKISEETGLKMMIRSFIALDLPASAKKALEEISQRLRDQVSHSSVRWSRVSGLHLTLQFLGNVDGTELPPIKAALTEVGQRYAPFTFAVAGLGCFPNPKNPRVVWVGVQEETGVLRALQRDVEKSLIPLGFKPERRAFHPHLTLGRVRRDARPSDQRQLGEIIARTEVGELDQVRVRWFRLMRSDLQPDGAVYTPLAVFNLTGEG
jgi:2'-5' RNA ligase